VVQAPQRITKHQIVCTRGKLYFLFVRITQKRKHVAVESVVRAHKYEKEITGHGILKEIYCEIPELATIALESCQNTYDLTFRRGKLTGVCYVDELGDS